jgi:hypothetical protein
MTANIWTRAPSSMPSHRAMISPAVSHYPVTDAGKARRRERMMREVARHG